jgi:primary-amine oxidase
MKSHEMSAAGRTWTVSNPLLRNPLGQPVGYRLVPGENALPLAAPGSSVRRRAGFVDAHLWVTRYAPAERYTAGDYVSQNPRADGLARWVRANRSIERADVVLWYTMGITHVPRPEDWPVMSTHRAGFKLVPSGFFARNPALDVPRPER